MIGVMYNGFCREGEGVRPRATLNGMKTAVAVGG
jgi:hypothetical protein